MPWFSTTSIKWPESNLLHFAGQEEGLSPVNEKVSKLASDSESHPVSNRVGAIFIGMPTGSAVGAAASSLFAAFKLDLWNDRGIWGKSYEVCTKITVNTGSFLTHVVAPLQRLEGSLMKADLGLSYAEGVAFDMGRWVQITSFGVKNSLLAGAACFFDSRAFTISKIGNAVLPIVNEYGLYIVGATVLGSLIGYKWYMNKCKAQEVKAGDQLVETLQRRITLAAKELPNQKNKLELAESIDRAKQDIKDELQANTNLSDTQVDKITKKLFKAAKEVLKAPEQ